MKTVRVSLLVRDPHARGTLFLFGGTAFHFLYGSFRLLVGVLYRSYSVDVTAFFYLSLALARLFLLRSQRERKGAEATACRLAGRALFVTAGLMLLLIADSMAGEPISYPFYALIASGGYAVASASLAILELLYLKRLRSPLLSASRAVGLASTLLSSFGFLSDVLLSIEVLPLPLLEAIRLALGAFVFIFVLFLAAGLSHKQKSDA